MKNFIWLAIMFALIGLAGHADLIARALIN